MLSFSSRTLELNQHLEFRRLETLLRLFPEQVNSTVDRYTIFCNQQ